MTTINKQIEIYVASDGTEFLTKDECVKYEDTTLAMLNKIQYFQYCTNMDLNETGMYYNNNYAAVYVESDRCQYEVLLQYLIDLHKGKVIHQNVQGYGVAATFSISVCTREEYVRAKPKMWGGSPTHVDKILLSEVPIDGFPKNVPVISKHFKYK